MKINELSKISGVNLETIRFYEKIGLLPEPKRLANGYRSYDDADLNRLNFIKTCRNLGFSVEETRQFQALKEEPKSHQQADLLVQQHLANVQQKIAQLQEIEAFLHTLVSEEAHDEADCKALSGVEEWKNGNR